MKTLSITLGFLLLLLSSNSFASTSKVLTCKFEGLKTESTLIMAIENFDNPLEIGLKEIYTDYEGEPTGISYDGEDLEWLFFLTSGWDSSFSSDKNGNIDFFLDSDGCDVGNLVLYKNSGYRYGYLSLRHHCSEIKKTYSKVKCEIADL